MSAHGTMDDYNIQDAWNRACGAFAQTANVDLTKSPKFTVDEVLDQIRTKQDADDEKNNKYRAAKDVIGKTLKFITVLGGIAAQGASMVFAPSSLCFNAISYLIDTGAKYKRIFSSLAELFRRISDVLERCKIYMRLPPDAVDISLRKIINEELLCFVDICALSIKVLKGNKILTALKVFSFDGDEGVSGQLARLASLVERESQMRATLGFESQKTSEQAIVETREGTKRVTTTVDKLLTFEKKRDADNTEQRLLNSIDNNLDRPSETYKAIQAIYKHRLTEQVQGSGEWLKGDPEYTAWMDTRGSQSQCSILGLSGDEGYGKSFLFAAIIRHLQEVYSEATEDMTCISSSYYIFDQQEKKDPSLTKALEVLAWQIAKVDIVYRKEIGTVKTAGVNQIEGLCEQLFSKSFKGDSTFFLLLDGVDQMHKHHLKEFMLVLEHWQASSWPRFRLRVLLTGRKETMEMVKNQLGEGIAVIDVASKNLSDMVCFVKDRMSKMEILAGSSDQVVALRGEILETLTKKTKGDFVNVGLLLDEISGKQRPGEIREILARSGENRSDTIVRKIDLLTETLSDEDISDLNELLTWVVFSFRPLGLDELEAVLFLKSREPSLRPLAEKIRDQYSSLFHIAGACVHLVSDSIKDFLLTKLNPEANKHDDNQQIMGEVSEAEVRIVRRFLESVCDSTLFNRFGFDEFFQRKIKGRAVRVGVDIETAHLTLVSGCLEVICSKPSSNIDALLPYAVPFFGEHLRQADPSLTQPHLKIALGPCLVKAFADEEAIDRWWSFNNAWLRSIWIYDDDMAEVILKWLQDSAVTKNISEEQSKWVKSLSSKSELDADVLEHIGRTLARRWLQIGAENVAFYFDAVQGYITKIENRKNPEIERLTHEPLTNEIQATDILNAAKWAQEQIKLDTLGYEESRNLSRTLRDYGKYDEAIEQFKITSTLAQNNWFSQWGLSECYASQGEYAAAIDILEATKKAIETGEMGDANELKWDMAGIDRNLADWNKEVGRTETTLVIYEKLIQETPNDYDTTLALIMLLHEQKNYPRLLEFLQSLKDSTDGSNPFDRQTSTFHVHYDREEYHEALRASVSGEREFKIIFESYETSIADAKALAAQGRKSGNASKEWSGQVCQIYLMHQIALLCYKNSSQKPDRLDFAINQWLYILTMNGADDSLITDKQAVVRSQLAVVCSEKARQDPENAAIYLEHLENISSLVSNENLAGQFLGTHAARLLARYHTLQGDEQAAKNTLRAHVKLNLDLLSDDDPLNDWQGYNGLAIYFMSAGQEADALAAWSMIAPIEATESTSDSAGSDAVERKLEGLLNDACDGGCGTQWSFADDIYVCKECSYVEFDRTCLDSLQDGTLEVNVCRKDHDMLHVPPYDRAAHQTIGEGNVKVGEEILSVDEWLQRIRKSWGIRT
ncbi:uncharacterized protein N7484_007303 [Penicillium longicatenatum]|uniref:uncharacterized protein n=1 Tax=Penicillium longicatenatum TaxID=1561947 RepID=UPI00254825BA|nr:uncharacterized protein N7484_007303 [Penicillium longicatenatum]KAJ5639441.1 hypothetical protein N7484_007303 [Penicillium longicatenatum]